MTGSTTGQRSRLTGHPAVREAAVVVLDGPVRKAYVILNAGWNAGPVTAEAVLRHADGDLDLVEFVDELPRTADGAVDRERLRRWLRSPLTEFVRRPHRDGGRAAG